MSVERQTFTSDRTRSAGQEACVGAPPARKPNGPHTALLELASKAVSCCECQCGNECLVEAACGIFKTRHVAVYIRSDAAPGAFVLSGSSSPAIGPLPEQICVGVGQGLNQVLSDISKKLEHQGAQMPASAEPTLVPIGSQESYLGFIAVWGSENHGPQLDEYAMLLSRLGVLCADRFVSRSQPVTRKPRRELEHRLATIGSMVSVIVHELRNPLVSINTFLELLPERFDDEEFRTRFLELTKSECDRLTMLVSELLDFSRDSSPSRTPCNLGGIIKDVLLLIQPQAKRQRIALKASYDPSLPPILLDRRKIKQVLINLLLNAVQASPHGGTVWLEATCTECSHGSQAHTVLEISVRDEGSGLEPDIAEQVFEPYFTTREDGVGLGLSITRNIVQQHDGHIEVRSLDPRGTEFKVSLPVADQKSG